MTEAPSAQDIAGATERQPGLSMIGILEFLQTPDAERITFEFLNANNQWVRQALGLTAVMRWPQKFLDSPSSHPDEHKKLLATLTVFHPELLSLVRRGMSAEELNRLRSDVIDFGVEVLFRLPHNAGLVF
jgi:hypothetical protein